MKSFFRLSKTQNDERLKWNRFAHRVFLLVCWVIVQLLLLMYWNYTLDPAMWIVLLAVNILWFRSEIPRLLP
jgi:hypothetical protein